MSFYNDLIDNAPAIVIAIPLLFAFATPLIGKINKYLRNIWAFLGVFLSGALMYVLAWEIFKDGGDVASVYVFGGAEGTTFDVLSNVRITFFVDGMAAFMGLIMATVAFAAIIYSFSGHASVHRSPITISLNRRKGYGLSSPTWGISYVSVTASEQPRWRHWRHRTALIRDACALGQCCSAATRLDQRVKKPLLPGIVGGQVLWVPLYAEGKRMGASGLAAIRMAGHLNCLYYFIRGTSGSDQ